MMKKVRKPTHRIPYEVWINSQLSIAKYYGGVQIQGRYYEFDPECVWGEDGKGKPDLVTFDKLPAEKKVIQDFKESPFGLADKPPAQGKRVGESYVG